MFGEKIISQFNIVSQCRKYGLSTWQCPQFLFLVMGAVIILSSVTFYIIGVNLIIDPEIVALIIFAIATVLFVITFSITRTLEGLAEASRMKSEFISIVSHQLRAPLTNLKWVAEILTSEKFHDSVEQEEYLASLKENSNRMLELVNDLLIISRIEQKNFSQRKEEVSMEELIEELIARFSAFSKDAGIEISFCHQENLPKVFFDRSQLKIIIENLLDNAVRYAPKCGKVEIWLGRKGGKMFFRISDGGIGIPKDEQKYIFQKFFRADNASKKQAQGSGLGLYAVKTIINKLGGKIWFESEENKGAEFYFTLPIK